MSFKVKKFRKKNVSATYISSIVIKVNVDYMDLISSQRNVIANDVT